MIGTDDDPDWQNDPRHAPLPRADRRDLLDPAPCAYYDDPLRMSVTKGGKIVVATPMQY